MSIENHLLLWGFVIGMYVFPAIVASIRNHPQVLAIWVLNVLLGWTVIGWCGAMVWAFVVPARRAT